MSSSDIEIELASGLRLPAYVATPAGGGSVAGVVVLQEIFGINANMRAVVDDYAARGFNAIAPDLFWRQEAGVELDPTSAEDRERATQLMKGMDQMVAVEDAQAAAEYLRRLGNANGRVGAIGYCLGGKLAFLLATKPGISAAASYYGVAIQGALDKAGDVRCPLLLHIAEDDHLCPPDAQEAIRQAFTSDPDVTVMTYPGVGHAFARLGGAAFDAAAAERANAATAQLFAVALDRAG